MTRTEGHIFTVRVTFIFVTPEKKLKIRKNINQCTLYNTGGGGGGGFPNYLFKHMNKKMQTKFNCRRVTFRGSMRVTRITVPLSGAGATTLLHVFNNRRRRSRNCYNPPRSHNPSRRHRVHPNRRP